MEFGKPNNMVCCTKGDAPSGITVSAADITTSEGAALSNGDFSKNLRGPAYIFQPLA